MSVLTDFQDKFQVDRLKVMENSGWILSIRPQQLTLGSMILSCKEEHRGFAELSINDSQEMGALLGEAERLAKRLFKAERINVLCLMMQDPLLHFHIFPRYPEVQDFAGVQWIDSDWPKPPTVAPVETDPQVITEILDFLRNEVSL